MPISSVPADPPPSAALHSKHYSDPTSNIFALAFGPTSAPVFLAVGTDTRVDVLIRDGDEHDLAYTTFKSFYVDCRVTALAWSDRSISPAGESTAYTIELAAVCSDDQIRLLTASSDTPKPSVTTFGGPLTGGHKARINDIAFCIIADSEVESVALASVSDDKTCIFWNLDESAMGSPAPWSRIQKSHRLLTVIKHPQIASGILACTSAGEVSEIPVPGNETGFAAIELNVPPRLANTLEGKREAQEGGAADWKPDNPDVVGAVYGTKWYIWDFNQLRGTAPTQSGDAQVRPGHAFRWSPVDSHLFATACFEPGAQHAVKIYDMRFPQKPISVPLPSAGERVTALSWSWEGPWIAVAKGRNVVFIRTDRGA